MRIHEEMFSLIYNSIHAQRWKRVFFSIFVILTSISLSACVNSNDFSNSELYPAIVKSNPLNAPVFNPLDESASMWEFSLLAMIKEEDIYLYGGAGHLNAGMVLYYKGQTIYLDLQHGLDGRGIVPQLLYHDFNNDGKKELAIILHIGSGTGVSVYDLHVLGIRNDGASTPKYAVYSLLHTDINKWMIAPMTAELIKGEDMLLFHFANNSHIIKIVDINDGYADIRNRALLTSDGEFIELSFGSIVRFEFEDTRIKATIGVGAYFENSILPQYFGEIEASVIFDGENLTLSNYTFLLYTDRFW